MAKLTIYDPAMCCSSGVCGPTVDPALPRVAGDLEWLKSQGVAVERYNLAHQPMAFAENPTVLGALRDAGEASLPLVLVDGQIVAQGRYPGREELAKWAGLAVERSCCSEESGASCCAEAKLERLGSLSVVTPGGGDLGDCCGR